MDFQVSLMGAEAPVLSNRDDMIDVERHKPLPLQLEAAN